MYIVYEITALTDVRKNKEDDQMRTATEVVHYLNENSISVYDLSEQLGLGRTTLRTRLMNLGYTLNAVDDWVYSGDALTEPGDVDVTSKRMVVAKNSTRSKTKDEQSKITIHQSLMQLNLNDQTTRTTISILDSQIKEMKKLATATRLRLSDVYSLAIAEFLEKYSKVEK